MGKRRKQSCTPNRMLAIDRRFDRDHFSMLKTYIIVSRKKHNKLSISLSKTDVGNMKTVIKIEYRNVHNYNV